MRLVLPIAVSLASVAFASPRTHDTRCRCIPVNATHLVGVGTSHDASGRTFTEYSYACDLGSGEHAYAIACVTQRSGHTSCACKRDGVTLRSVSSPAPFGDPNRAIDACRFPS